MNLWIEEILFINIGLNQLDLGIVISELTKLFSFTSNLGFKTEVPISRCNLRPK